MKTRIAFAGLLMMGILAKADDVATLAKTCTKADLNVGKQKIEAFIADDDSRRARGLMFVEALPENTGMLFIFDEETPQSFWMKNTRMDLSIGFFSAAGDLVDVQEMKVPSVMDQNPPSYLSKGKAMFALEMNPGWFTKHGVTKGAHLRIASPASSPLLTKKLGKFSRQ